MIIQLDIFGGEMIIKLDFSYQLHSGLELDLVTSVNKHMLATINPFDAILQVSTHMADLSLSQNFMFQNSVFNVRMYANQATIPTINLNRNITDSKDSLILN